MKIRLSMSRWIVLTCLMATLPLLAFSGFSIWRLYAVQSRAVQSSLPQRANLLATAVLGRFDRGFSALEALAASSEVPEGDLNGLYQHARRILADQSDAVSISLMRRDGSLLFTTARPLGEPLPLSKGRPFEGPVFDARQRVLTPLFVSATSQVFVTVLALPVDWPGEGRLSLRMALPEGAFSRAIDAQGMPSDWLASVLDPQHRIAARSRNLPPATGEVASASVAGSVERNSSGVVDVTSREGIASRAATAQIGATGWAVVVAAPRTVLAGLLQESLTGLLATGAACLMLAGFTAWWLARRLGKEAHGLVGDASGSGRAGVVIEFESAAAQIRLSREQARRQSDQLREARRDDLTGLAGRAWFIDLSRRRMLAAGADPQERAALLFIDLDGFKQINDRLGHERGDAVLAAAALAIRDAVRDVDLAGRWGGDEFAVLVTASSNVIETVARAMAARVLKQVATVGDGLGCSIGIAVDARRDPPAPAPSLDDLLGLADRAMLSAKQAGKNRFELVLWREEARVL